MNDPSRGPVAFVVGQGRSGTTLLQQMLDAHPELAFIRETYFIPRLVEDWPLLYRDAHLDVDAVLETSRGRLEELLVDTGEVRRRLTELSEPTPAGVSRVICEVFADRDGKQRWGDKTPRYVLHMDLLARTFPETKFVHLIRDGRDVWLSYRDQIFGPTRLSDAADEWRWRVGTGRRSGKRLGPERYLETRYEDLVRDPEATLTQVCSFLQIPYDPVMLRAHESADAKLPPIEVNPHHAHLRFPVTSGLRDWRTSLGDAEVREYEAVAGGLLEDLGYERRFPGVMPLAVARGWLRTRGRAWRRAKARLHLRTRIRRRLRRGPPTG